MSNGITFEGESLNNYLQTEKGKELLTCLQEQNRMPLYKKPLVPYTIYVKEKPQKEKPQGVLTYCRSKVMKEDIKRKMAKCDSLTDKVLTAMISGMWLDTHKIVELIPDSKAPSVSSIISVALSSPLRDYFDVQKAKGQAISFRWTESKGDKLSSLDAIKPIFNSFANKRPSKKSVKGQDPIKGKVGKGRDIDSFEETSAPPATYAQISDMTIRDFIEFFGSLGMKVSINIEEANYVHPTKSVQGLRR